MKQQHPITPPRELVEQWADMIATHTDTEVFFAVAQWGADQELEACCQALYDRYDSVRRATGFPGSDMSDWLRAARRPKPKSEKQQALDAFDRIEYAPSEAEDFAIIRRALESIPDHS